MEDSRSTLPPIERWGLLGLSLVSLMLALGFALQFPPITGLWPWPDTRLSYTLVGAILAAITAPIPWVALTGERGALSGGAIVMLVLFGGMAAQTLRVTFDGTHAALPHAIAFFVGYVLVLGIYLRARRFTVRDSRPVPRLVRLSFAVFATVLVLIGTALILQVPNVLPWSLNPESSVMFGLMFLGPAAYFVQGLTQPTWHGSAGQLLAFLAYDVILVGPLMGHFATVRPEHRIGLAVYMAVILYSAVLAVYYLVINPATRLWRAER